MLRQKQNSTTHGFSHYSHSNGTRPKQDYNQHQRNNDKQSGNRDGCHSNSHHRHHGRSNDYHYGSSGDTRRMQCGRSNNRHRTGMIANSITHESGKFLNYHQMNGQHQCASSTSKSKDHNNQCKEAIVAGQALVLSPKTKCNFQEVGEPSSESPPPSITMNAKQLKNRRKREKLRINRMGRNTVHNTFAHYMDFLKKNQ